jgi:hypothetical protein
MAAAASSSCPCLVKCKKSLNDLTKKKFEGEALERERGLNERG